jgi:hypothetical protein
MPGIESFGRRKPTSDADELRRFQSEPIVFTDEEQSAIQRNLDMYRSIMQAEASEGGDWYVHPRVKDGMVAQGLYYYADELLSSFRLDDASETEAASTLQKAMIAKMKCLKIFPLPILMYQIGVLMDALRAPDAATMFRSFLEAQNQFEPGEFDKLLLDTIQPDIPAAIADARKRLGLHL